jgi:dethiobiotin synthetase
MSRALFITGTDTEIGKTTATAALAQIARAAGWHTVALKPIAAGLHHENGEWLNDDVEALRVSSSGKPGAHEICPYTLEAACAPHIAAQLEGRSFDRLKLKSHVEQHRAQADFTLVEGVGGFCVPLQPHFSTADWAKDLGLEVVLVVGLRLGCLNHALLTAHFIRTQGLHLRAWIANTLQAGMPYLEDNIAYLQSRFQQQGVAYWGQLPRLKHRPDSPDFLPEVAPHLSAFHDWLQHSA